MEDEQLVGIETKLKSIDEVLDELFKLDSDGWEVPLTMFANPEEDSKTDGLVEIPQPSFILKDEPFTTRYWMKDGRRYSFERWCEVTDKTQEEIMLLKLKYG